MSEFEHRAAAPRSVTVQIVTLSDTRTTATDTSGQAIHDALTAAGHRVTDSRILREDPATMPAELARVLRDAASDAVIVTGGTGVGPHDLAFDVLAKVYESPIPGFGELFRALSYQEIGSAALLSRASAGIAHGRIIFSIPGSRGAVRLALEKLILPELAHLVGERRRAPGDAP